MQKRPKNLDLNELAKRIVDEAVGDQEKTPAPKEKDAGAIERGKARAKKLTPEQRTKIAKLAAQERWSKQSEVKSDESPARKKHHIKISGQND